MPVEVEVGVGGAGCVRMKGGCEIFLHCLRVSRPFARLCPGEAASSDVILREGVGVKCDKRC